MQSKFIKTNRHKIHYLQAGTGQKLVLLHSLGISSRSYHQIGDRLAENFNVIIPDLGESNASDNALLNSFDDYTCLLDEFLNAFKIKRVNLLGFSFGGLVATKYALNYPEKTNSLFLTSTTLVPIGKFHLLGGYPRLFSKNLLTRKGRKLNWLWITDELVSFTKHPRQYLVNLWLGFQNLSEKIIKLEVSHLLILADKDEFIPPESIKEMKTLKGINIKITPGHHDWYFLDTEKFVEEVLEFF